MKITFAQGWSARPFKEQFPELTDIEAQKLDKVNEAITRLYLDDMLTDEQLYTIRDKKFPRLVSKTVSQARKEKRREEMTTTQQPEALRFIKKPVVIEAFQMTEERRASNADWPEWMHQAWQLDREAPGSLYPTEEGTGDGTLSIGTLEGPHLVSWGDWIIRGVKGELYPCKPDIFEATYEAA